MAAQFKARYRAPEPVREPQWLGTIPHAATSKSSSNGWERSGPKGQSALRSTHLLARSVSDPSVISPTVSPDQGVGCRVQGHLPQSSVLLGAAPRLAGRRKLEDRGSAGTFDVSENFYATTFRLLQIILSG